VRIIPAPAAPRYRRSMGSALKVPEGHSLGVQFTAVPIRDRGVLPFSDSVFLPLPVLEPKGAEIGGLGRVLASPMRDAPRLDRPANGIEELLGRGKLLGLLTTVCHTACRRLADVRAGRADPA
jgi:hypothetical protein